MNTTPFDLYSFATPNGQKISIALELMGLHYNSHTIDIRNGDQHQPDFIQLSPNGKIPVLVDPTGDNGKPLALMESVEILLYLAAYSEKLGPKNELDRHKMMQWLLFQVGHIGPMFGQFGHFFVYAKDTCDHPYPLDRYTKETQRLLGVLDNQLVKTGFMHSDELTIVDIAIAPWVHCLSEFYHAQSILELDQFTNVMPWLNRFLDSPKVQKGLQVCAPA